MEFNAGAGDRVTNRWSSGSPSSGSRSSTASQPGAYVRDNVANAIRGATSPEAQAAALSQYRQDGLLWEDDDSQNKAAAVFMQNQIGNLRDTYMTRDGSDYETAGQAAYDGIEQLFSETDATRDLWQRFARQTATTERALSRGTSSRTTTQGKDELPEFYNPQTGELARNVWEIDPFMFDQETTVDRINNEILEKESRLKPQLNIIDRAREVNEEAFGPSIFQAIRGIPERRRQRETDDDVQARITEYLSIPGNDMESLRRVVTGQAPAPSPAPAPPSEATAVTAPARTEVVRLPNDNTYEYKREDGQWLTRKIGDETWIDFSGMSDEQRRTANSTLNNAFPRAPVAEQPPVERMAVPTANDIVDGEEELVTDPRFDYPVDLPALEGDGVPAGPVDTDPLGPLEVEPANEDGNFMGTPLEGIEDPDIETTPDVVGSDAQHAGNMLNAAVAATDLVSRPSQLSRRIANAESGTPISFASTMMDNWKGQAPDARASLQDMVANLASQYNGVDDTTGRNQATEYLMAMYQLEQDAPLLTNTETTV